MNKQLQDSLGSDKSSQSPQQLHSKRPRTSTACVRCHLKKVRCDGRRPNCDRCAANEKMCAYPTRRRSRNTQPTDMDPFIDDLSQLETRIRAIESEQETLWDLIQRYETADDLVPRMVIIDQEVQTSRASLARQRLLREQHIARNKQQHLLTLSSSDKNSHNNKQLPRKKNSMVAVKDKQPLQQQVTIPPYPLACAVQPPWDEMFPTLSWTPPPQQQQQVQQPESTQQQHQQGPPKEWFGQQQQAQNAQHRLQHQSVYASSSTSTTSSGSPPFHPPNDVMMEPYELMHFVMDDESLMMNPQDNTGGHWLGHPRL